MIEDHLEAIRIRLPLLRPEELLQVRQLVEARITERAMATVMEVLE
jgi:hypothetical protein